MEILLGPDENQMNLIRAELGEDDDRFENNRKLLQKWIACQPHLPQNYDPEILSTFMRGCKHNLEKTKKKIEAYFVARSSVPDIFSARNPTLEEIEFVQQTVQIIPLPRLTPEGHRITIIRLATSDIANFDIKDCIRLMFMIGDVRVKEEHPIAGDIFIYDANGLATEHCVQFVSPLVKKAVSLAHTVYPQRLHKVHVVGVSALIEKLIQFTKSLLKEKLRNRFVVHKSPETLTDHIPKEVLPIEYCGTGESIKNLNVRWARCIANHAEWFQKQENVKVCGAVPSSVVHACGLEDGLGIQGSFRQLAID